MRKTIYRRFSYTECDDLAAFLQEMAAQGWHFKEWAIGFVFEKGEPETVEYAVEVFIKGSEMDMKPEPHTEEFAEYCEVAGWKLVDAKRKFCIFKKMREDAVPIVTPEERLENIAKAAMGERTSRVAVMLILCVSQWFSFLSYNFEMYIFQNSMIFLLAGITLACLYAVCDCLHLILWKRRNKKKIRTGETVYYGVRNGNHTRKERQAGLWLLVFTSIVVVFLWQEGQQFMALLPAITLLVLLVMDALIRKFRPTSAMNYMIQLCASFLIFGLLVGFSTYMVITDEEESVVNKTQVLLLQEEYKEVGEFQEAIKEEAQSIFGETMYCDVTYEDSNVYEEAAIHEETDDTIRYQIYESKYQWLLDAIWKEETKYMDSAEQCAEEWGAEEAIKGKLSLYFVRYENKILVFYEDTNLSQDQINLIREKLELR